MEDRTLTAFKAIHSFISALDQEYGTKYRFLRRYAVLLSKTQIINEAQINRNIDLFRNFVVKNRDAIINNDKTRFVDGNIRYSERIYVNIPNIFTFTDNNTENVIWAHLLTISAILDPNGNAIAVLKNNPKGHTEGTPNEENKNESNFLTDLISKVEEKAGSGSGDSLSNILNPALLTDIMGSMQSGLASGKLDLGKLMGSVQGMLSTITEKNPENKQMFDTLNTNISALTSGGNTSTLDMGSMMQMMTGMLGNMNLPPQGTTQDDSQGTTQEQEAPQDPTP